MTDWEIQEHKDVVKARRRLPAHIVQKYDVWLLDVRMHGPAILRQRPHWEDKALKGIWEGCRRSKLSRSYRVIYEASNEERVVYVDAVNNHKYD